MALDAICLQAVVAEVAPQVQGLKIEKIQQPTRDQVILLLRGNRRLLLCASPSQPRLNLTALLRDNPSQPPMFCMLLRKHLSGGRILSMEQAPLERVVTLEIEAMNELGEMGRFSLVLEAMNRHSNLILCGGDGRIIDCMRRVDFEMSQQRQVLPGLYYHLPPRQEKRSPLEVEEQEFRTLLESASPERQTDKWLLDTFTAIAPLWAREMAFRAGGSTDCLLSAAFHLYAPSRVEFFVKRLVERILFDANEPCAQRGAAHGHAVAALQFGDGASVACEQYFIRLGGGNSRRQHRFG